MTDIIISADASRRQPDGFSLIQLNLPEAQDQRRLDMNLAQLAPFCTEPVALALDFLVLGAACYASDKLVSRSDAPDCWTREFHLTVPVSAPTAWQNVADTLADRLRFLTGDEWSFTFEEVSGAFYQRPDHGRRTAPAPPFTTPEAVSLFSGGLDSLSGAIDLLASGQQRLLLVSHYDTPAGEQDAVGSQLRAEYPGQCALARSRVRLGPARAIETSLRSRSVLFLALGVYAASSAGGTVPIYAYENGHIAVNVPLTPSRAGSCSTRTMHPYFLEGIGSILATIGLTNPILRPYDFRTKGEVVAWCANPHLLQRLLPASVSCSHPNRRQWWIRRQARNCGYCMPCLIRRGALHAIDGDDGTAYGIDVCGSELPEHRQSARDLVAMRDCLRQRKTVATIAEEIITSGPVDHLAERAAVVSRGFDEIRMLIRDKGDSRQKRLAGLE